MTIFFPDVANFQRGLVIQPNTVFVWAKSSEGTTYADDTYAGFQSQAAAVGAGFGAYHFLHQGNGAQQASWAFSIVGPDVPLFIDVEPTGSSNPTPQDVFDFKTQYRALGGTVEVMYFPKWYWQNLGSPDLSWLGLQLISSGYEGYSDSSANWNAYGNVTPFQWQFTDQFGYGGLAVDFNAYKGELSQYLSTIGHSQIVPPNAPVSQEEDLNTTSANGRAGLSWAAGTRHVVQVTYDGAGYTTDLKLRAVLLLTTGPLVLSDSWSPTGGSGVLEIPNSAIATCRGVVLNATGTGMPVYDVIAV